MPPLSTHSLRLLLEATEILHAHGKSTFHERLFQAASLLFHDVGHTFEMYDGHGRCLAAHADLPMDGPQLTQVLSRIAELVPTQNPMYAEIVKGEKNPLRLSDFASHRVFRRTDLYHDVFRPAAVKHQMAVPIHAQSSAGGLTVNLHDRDFTVEEVALAGLFARHVAVAFESDQIIHASVGAAEQMISLDFSQLRRLGLSPRECEVVCWLAEGKRDGETAVILGISTRTVHAHVRAILGKLHVETRTAAVAVCLRELSKGHSGTFAREAASSP